MAIIKWPGNVVTVTSRRHGEMSLAGNSRDVMGTFSEPADWPARQASSQWVARTRVTSQARREERRDLRSDWLTARGVGGAKSGTDSDCA